MVARVVLPWQTVPSLIQAMRQNLENHARRFGRPPPFDNEEEPDDELDDLDLDDFREPDDDDLEPEPDLDLDFDLDRFDLGLLNDDALEPRLEPDPGDSAPL